MTAPVPVTDSERRVLHRRAVELHEEYAGVFGVETIEQLVLSSFEHIVGRSTTRNQFRLVLVERFARERLQALARAQGHTGHDLPAVLFVCTHNARRSQMAFGWFTHLTGDRALAWSGGSDPVGSVDPVAVTAMAEVGIDISSGYSKPWTEEVLLAADVVVTMGCGDACPLFPGKRYEDWEIDDPAGQPLEVVRLIRDEIGRHVVGLLDHLGIPPAKTPRLVEPAQAMTAPTPPAPTPPEPAPSVSGLRRRWRHAARPAARG